MDAKNNKKHNRGHTKKKNKRNGGKKNMQKPKSIKRDNSKKEKAKLKGHSGITLIALIITIIVLLILAGVALATLTGDSGILNNADKAKEQTNLANSKEQVKLAIQGALTEGIGKVTKANLVTELDKLLGAGEENYTITPNDETGPWTVTVTKTGYSTTISSTGKMTEQPSSGGGDTATLPTGKGTTPWLPAGFSQVAGTNLTNGLTITNTTDGTIGNQNYVWIEVPTTISASITREGTATTVTLADAQTDSEILEILEVYAGKGTEQDYTKGSSSQSCDWTDQWYDSTGKTKEGGATNLEDTAGCGMSYTEYQDAYSKMLNSIKDNGGFWLAQYEAGIAYEEDGATATNRTSHTTITTYTSANYAKDQYPYNYVYCSEAQKIANADSVVGKYTSSLPFGIQWDLVCKFLEVKTGLDYADIATQSKWGNYYDTTYTPSSQTAKYSADYGESFDLVVAEDGTAYEKTSAGDVLLTTGALEKITGICPYDEEMDEYGEPETISVDANPMNIYDFAGNEWEWTLEYTANTYRPCAIRGDGYSSYFSFNLPASVRYHDGTETAAEYGFRGVLY